MYSAISCKYSLKINSDWVESVPISSRYLYIKKNLVSFTSFEIVFLAQSNVPVKIGVSPGATFG